MLNGYNLAEIRDCVGSLKQQLCAVRNYIVQVRTYLTAGTDLPHLCIHLEN